MMLCLIIFKLNRGVEGNGVRCEREGSYSIGASQVFKRNDVRMLMSSFNSKIIKSQLAMCPNCNVPMCPNHVTRHLNYVYSSSLLDID